jgi:hypothetical protein
MAELEYLTTRYAVSADIHVSRASGQLLWSVRSMNQREQQRVKVWKEGDGD